MKKISVLSVLSLACLALTLTSSALAQRILFGVDAGANTVVTINSNGSTTFFAALPFSWEGAHRTGFDYNPADGLLYASRGVSEGVEYYSINPVNAQILYTGKFIPLSETLVWHTALGFTAEGDVYAYGDRSAFQTGTFVSLNFESLAVSIRPNNSGSPSVFGGDWDTQRNVFWASDEFTGQVYQLDAVTGERIWASSSTWLNSSLGDLYDMDVSEESILVVAADNTTTPRTFSVLQIDAVTGQWSELFQLPSGSEVQSIASVPAPVYEVSLILQSSSNLTNWTPVLTNIVETYNPQEFYKNDISVRIKAP